MPRAVGKDVRIPQKKSRAARPHRGHLLSQYRFEVHLSGEEVSPGPHFRRIIRKHKAIGSLNLYAQMDVTPRREMIAFVPCLSFFCHAPRSAFFRTYNPDQTFNFPQTRHWGCVDGSSNAFLCAEPDRAFDEIHCSCCDRNHYKFVGAVGQESSDGVRPCLQWTLGRPAHAEKRGREHA